MKWGKANKEKLRSLIKNKFDQIIDDLENKNGHSYGWGLSPELISFLDLFRIKMINWDCGFKCITLSETHLPNFKPWEPGDSIPQYKRRKNTIVIPGPYDPNYKQRWDHALEIPKEIAEKFLIIGVP